MRLSVRASARGPQRQADRGHSAKSGEQHPTSVQVSLLPPQQRRGEVHHIDRHVTADQQEGSSRDQRSGSPAGKSSEGTSVAVILVVDEGSELLVEAIGEGPPPV